jgi:hypothetical protein
MLRLYLQLLYKGAPLNFDVNTAFFRWLYGKSRHSCFRANRDYVLLSAAGLIEFHNPVFLPIVQEE